MKLIEMIEIKGNITLRSGLHIGAGDTEMKIGGTDNAVVKHPHTLEPFIPGSSLKGKVRSLLEMRSGLMGNSGGAPLKLKDLNGLSGKEREDCENILKLFGSGAADKDDASLLGPTRVSFADCLLTREWRKKASEEHLDFVEVKSENSINRIKGTAENPRFTERVPAGAEFRMRITLKKLEPDEDLVPFLLEGLKLLEMDALGGSGSRGYGRIAFNFDNPDIQKRFNETQPL